MPVFYVHTSAGFASTPAPSTEGAAVTAVLQGAQVNSAAAVLGGILGTAPIRATLVGVQANTGVGVLAGNMGLVLSPVT